MSYRLKPVVKEPSGQTLPKQANADVSLPMYVAPPAIPPAGWQGRGEFRREARQAPRRQPRGAFPRQVRSSGSASPDIAPAHYGKAIGKGGARISYIREKYGVRVTLDRRMSANVRGAISWRSSSSRTCNRRSFPKTSASLRKRRMPRRSPWRTRILCLNRQGKGPYADAKKKLADIEGQVRSSGSASPDIAPAHYGKAIGKGGAHISYIREKYGVRVNAPKDRGSPIVVSGLSANVRGAIKELEELVQQDVLQQRVVLPVEILPKDIGIAIGKGGCHVSKVQGEFGVQLRTHSREHPEGPLLVEGPLGAAEKAVASIQLQILVTGLKENARAAVAKLELMANLKLRPEHVLMPLYIRREEHILALGLEVSMTAWIERNYGVQFLWPRAENMPLLLVRLAEDVSRAEAAIMKRLSGH
ncbi:hypothetical protein C7M84_012408 [Penaeus vannamei]|uniref:K Homology domain-containing protein n=1 Tax=Penaeus vannamei TaxID=6689 RepID=A0A3R7M7R4_PENVA|nr:hypothetical protein C7M84_012408 [Penaeus vannamei]